MRARQPEAHSPFGGAWQISERITQGGTPLLRPSNRRIWVMDLDSLCANVTRGSATPPRCGRGFADASTVMSHGRYAAHY
jgi:hypothetical protein